MRKDKA